MVDAPGKKHRKLVRADPRGNLEDSQAAKMRMAGTMIKTNRGRGRGWIRHKVRRVCSTQKPFQVTKPSRRAARFRDSP